MALVSMRKNKLPNHTHTRHGNDAQCLGASGKTGPTNLLCLTTMTNRVSIVSVMSYIVVERRVLVMAFARRRQPQHNEHQAPSNAADRSRLSIDVRVVSHHHRAKTPPAIAQKPPLL